MRIMQQSIFYRIAVFTSESELDIKIAASDLDSEVKHIGIGKYYFCYVASRFVGSTLDLTVYSVYLYRLKCQMRGVILPADGLICRYVPVI